jgi:hypothetical protein
MKRNSSSARDVVAGLVLALLLALAAAGCGGSGSSHPTSTGTGSSTVSDPGTTSTASAGVTGVPTGDVAAVDGTPISRATYQHWVTAAADSNATSTKAPVEDVILPLFPPTFSICLYDISAHLPSLSSKSTAVKVKDCRQLFTVVNADVLGFLITERWYQAYAQQLGITVSAAQVNASLAKQRKASFSSASEYQQFLKDEGETQADILLRTRISLVLAQLEKRVKGAKTAAAAEKQVDATVKRLYGAKTLCAPAYVMADCTKA